MFSALLSAGVVLGPGAPVAGSRLDGDTVLPGGLAPG